MRSILTERALFCWLNCQYSHHLLTYRPTGLLNARPRRIGHELSLPFLRYGERFRKHRRWMHDAVGSKGSLLKYRPIQVREAHLLLRNLLETPDNFIEHIYRYAAPRLSAPRGMPK